MRNYKIFIKIGAVAGVVGSLLLAYNFVNMYSLASKCPVNINIQPCKAYSDWQILNNIALLILVVSFVMLVYGFVARRNGKH